MTRDMPPAIRIAIYLLSAFLFLTVLKNLLYFAFTSIQIFTDWLNLLDLAFALVIVILGYFIYQRQDWARWVYLIVVLLGLMIALIYLVRVLQHPVILIVVLLVYLCQWTSLYFLFGKKTQNWFQ